MEINEDKRKGTKLIRVENNIAYIRLNNSDKIAKIDYEDYDKIKRYSWRIHANRDYRKFIKRKINYYVITRRFKGETPQTMLLHRYIMGIEKENAVSSKRQIDHINRNGLDNRKSNLRIVTQSQNNHNICRGVHGKYPYIRWRNRNGKFYGKIKIEKKMIYTGEFDTPDEALKEYHKLRIKHLKNQRLWK